MNINSYLKKGLNYQIIYFLTLSFTILSRIVSTLSAKEWGDRVVQDGTESKLKVHF